MTRTLLASILAVFAIMLVPCLALGDSPPWVQVASTGPSPRQLHAMAYDAERGRVVLFGGVGGDFPGDTWEWEGSAWSQRATTGPSPRHSPAMAHDTARGRTVLFGGWDGSSYRGDTWEWDGSAWSQRATTGPSPRNTHAMTYDSARGCVVLFGGLDTWGAIDSDTWELPSALPPPPCLGDASGDFVINFADITSVLSNWGATYPGGTGPGDATHDGVVNFVDITQVLTTWGASCPA